VAPVTRTVRSAIAIYGEFERFCTSSMSVMVRIEVRVEASYLKVGGWNIAR
jgi:hypothetical protein